MSALITAMDNLTGSGISGATTLLTGNTGGLIVVGLAIVIIGIIVGAIFYFASFAKKR